MNAIYIYLTFVALLFITSDIKAQAGDYDTKILLFNRKTITGHLMVVNVEGVGIEDYKSKYHTLKVNTIKSIVVKKRRLPFRNCIGIGTVAGLTAALIVLTAAEKAEVTDGVVEIGVALTAAGALGGTIAGTVSELTKRKLKLKVNGDYLYFKANYQRLQHYISTNYATEFSAN
jgi:hypothetical protein